MSNCKIFRNKDKSINKVMDEFGNESQLYQDTLFHVSTLVDKIPLTPPIKHYLDKGDIMDTSVSEVALGLWAYSYSKHFRDKYNITKSNLEEVSVDDIIRHIEEYYPKPVTATPTVIQQEVKEGVKELFNSNPELSNIGTQEQYSQYLDTVFPDSKVKDIVYRGAEKGIENHRAYSHWTLRKVLAENFAKQGVNLNKKDESNTTVYFALLNVKNLIRTIEITDKNLKNKGFDSAASFPNQKKPDGTYYDDEEANESIQFINKNLNNEITVFEPKQIHILGSNNDIQGFKKFVSSNVIPEVETNINYQLASDVINPAIEELDNYLLDFLKNFNVKSEQVEGLKAVLGMDALGVTDVLNKLILYIKNRNEETLPEESAHMIVALMGENHPDIKELISTITNWSEYNDIKNQYLPVYNDENKVKIEAIGKLIAKALVKNYKVNGLDKNKLQKTLDRILKYIKEILDSISFNNIFMYNEFVADHIAINVLSGNKDYIYKIKNLNPNLNAEEEINNNPNAKKIIDMFSSDNVKLTGSLAIAGTENIRRPKGEAIHDIDFKVKSFEVFEKEVLSKLPENSVPIHFGWHKRTYSTYAYAIPLEGYRIKVLKRRGGFSNGRVDNYLLYNEKNEKVTPTQQNVMSVDFFVYKDGVKQKDFDFSSKYIPATFVYEGKMSLGGKSNPYFFSRDKDQEDYVLRDPKSFIHFTKHLYYQLPKQIEPTYNPETKSKTELLDEFNKLIEVSEKMGTKYPDDAINKIKSFLQDLNFKLSTVKEILDKRGLNDNPKAVIDFAYNTIAFGDGATVEDFAEEIGHLIALHAPQDKNLDRALEVIKDTQLYKDNYLNYVKTYSKPGLALEMTPERKAALEVLGRFYGKMLTGTLTEKDMKISKLSVFKRIMNFIRRQINKTDNFNLRNYLESNRDNFFLEPGKEIKSKEIFYSLEQSENVAYNKMFNAIDNMITSMKSRMAREIKDVSAPLGEYSKRQANLQTQLALLYQMQGNIAYDSAIADFLKSLYVDSANIFKFLEKYFVVKKQTEEITLNDIKFNTEEKIFVGDAIIENNSTTLTFDMFRLGRLKKDADLSTLHYSQLSELREFLMHYNSFIKELGIENLSNNLLNDSQLDDLRELLNYVTVSLSSIENALNILNSKKMPESIENLIDEAGIDINDIPKDIVDALKDTNIKGDVGMMQYLMGTTRDSSQPILRLFNATVKNIMHIAKRNTLSFAGKFLDKLNHRIGQSMDWAYEKYNDKFTGYLLSEYNYGWFKNERDTFFKEINAKYEYPVDFNAKEVMFNRIITRFNNNDKYKEELKALKVKLNKELDANKRTQYEEQIDTLNTLIDNVELDHKKLKSYQNEINNWFKDNTVELENVEEIIQSVINDPELSSTEKTVWYNNNVITNEDGDVMGYKNELVRPSSKYVNPDYKKLSSIDLEDLNYIKKTKEELDKFLPTKLNKLAPQTYQSAMDTLIKTQLPELVDKLKFLGKDIGTKKEDDKIGELVGDRVNYEDETRIIKYNPTRYTKLLLEPNNISTDLLSSMIAYAKMVSEFKEKAERIEQLEFIAQNIKNGYTVNTDTNMSSPSNTSNLVKQMENYLRVQIMGITYPDVTIPVLNVKPTKLLKNFARFVTLKNLGLNFATQFVDFTTSRIWYQVEKTMGDTVTKKSSALGFATFKELAQDSIKESSSTIKNNKLSAILRTLGLSDNLHSVFNDLDKNILMRDASNKVLFAGYRASNFYVSGNAALAGMYNFRLYNGKWYTEREFGKIENPTEQFDSLPSAYDNMRVENGLMTIDGMNTKTLNLFTRRMNNLISKIDGKLTEEDKTYAHSTLIGIVTLIHRDWILDGISRRLKKRGFNFDTNAVDEGYWLTTARFMKDFFANKEKTKNLKFLVDNYNALSDIEKEGVRRTMKELMVVVGSIALAIIMNLGDDDDERELDYIRDMAAYLATRSTVEITAFYNPFEYLYAATDVFVIGRDLKRIMTFTEMFDAREIESGKWEGWTRSQKYFLQNIPGVNGALSVASPEASNRFIINNVLGFAGGLDKLKYYDVPLIGTLDDQELLEIERDKR